MNYEGDNAVVPHMGNRKAYKVYQGNYLLYVAALTVAWESGEDSGSFSDDYSSFIQRTLLEQTITHSVDISITESYSETCNGLVYFDDYVNTSETSRYKVKRCHSCNHIYGRVVETQTQPSVWQVVDTSGDTTTSSYTCTLTVQKIRTVTECPANTDHGDLVISIIGAKQLYAHIYNSADLGTPEFKWKKDGNVISSSDTCLLQGSGTYTCEVTVKDDNTTSYLLKPSASASITITY